MASPNLAIVHIVASQNQKEVTANEAFDDLDRATQGKLEFGIADLAGSPTEADRTLTAEEFNQTAFLFILDGAPTVPFAFVVPANQRFFCVENISGQTVTVRTDEAIGGSPDLSTVSITDGNRQLLYCDGQNVIPLAAAIAV